MKKYSDAHVLFEQLVFPSMQKSPVPLERVIPDDGLKMVAHHHPWSVKPREFDFLRSLVASYDLHCGFEVATAFRDEALIRDLGAVSPFLAERAVAVFHDTHCFGPPAQDFVERTLGASWMVPPAFQRGQGWHLGHVARGVDVSELAADYA